MSLLALTLAVALEAPAPPDERRAPSRCRCEAANVAVDVVFEGVAFDAIVLLSENGRDPLPRQATLFHVARKLRGEVGAKEKVWHVVDQDACGVAFAYGRRYTVKARKTKDGLETDSCLLNAPVK